MLNPSIISPLSVEAKSHIQALSSEHVSPQAIQAAESFLRCKGDELSSIDSVTFASFYYKLVEVQETNPQNPEAVLRPRKKKGKPKKPVILRKRKRGFGPK